MFLVNTAATFGVDFGTGSSLGAVTVDITRADGTLLVDDGATTDVGDGTYTFELSVGLNTKIDLLRLEWTVTSTSEVVPTHEEIVGTLLFTIAEARGARFTGQQAPLSNTTTFPDAVIARTREQIVSMFEQKTGRSWVRRYCRVELPGTGGHVLSLAGAHARAADGNSVGGQGRHRDIAKITSATADGVSITPADLVVDGFRVLHTSGTWPAPSTSEPLNVVLEYEYGLDPVPLEARENGLRMVVANLVPSDVPDYAQTFSLAGESTSFQQTDALRGMLRVYPEKVREWLDRNKSLAIA